MYCLIHSLYANIVYLASCIMMCFIQFCNVRGARYSEEIAHAHKIVHVLLNAHARCMDALCWRSRRREMMEEVYAIAACQPTAQPKHPDVRATQMSQSNCLYSSTCTVLRYNIPLSRYRAVSQRVLHSMLCCDRRR